MKNNSWLLTDETINDGIKTRINGYYANANADYGVEGHFEGIMTDGDAIAIIGMEDGKYTVAIIEYYKDYSIEQMYNIWMDTYVK